MSEYQYYEFVALDKTLSTAQLAELGQISSRAEISSNRFAVVYNYGDFRGDTQVFMTRYFDAMVYVSNWGTHRLMLSLPSNLVDQALMQAYCTDTSVSMQVKGKTLVLDLTSNLEDFAGWEEGEGWLSLLTPVRDELMKGDLRALYIAWLLGVQERELDEGTLEPPVPSGLGQLSNALENLADYLRVDPDLLAAAAADSAKQTTMTAGISDWIAALQEAEKNELLVKLVEGQAPQLAAQLLRRYRAATQKPATASVGTRRTAGELLAAAEQKQVQREQQEAQREAEARAKYLDALAPRQAAIWQQIENLAEKRHGKSYAEAINLLKDLQELSQRQDKLAQFEQKLANLCERHQKKLTFIKRIKEAQLR